MLTIQASKASAKMMMGASPRSLGASPLRAVRPLPSARRAPVTQAVFKGQDKVSALSFWGVGSGSELLPRGWFPAIARKQAPASACSA
eukprot:scaffold52009_cov15-Tisochrysis_lutea.AAC.1